jgi:4-amino-4-deoxy-L-arabinose transferase-like glycosyltransferase
MTGSAGRPLATWLAGRPWVAPLALCLVSLIPRLPNLDAPPLDRHDFRQTQTAVTVQAFLDRGISVAAYETPVFGPPWRVPFELPIYQLSVVPLARLGLSLDVACRMAALIWFYASAALLVAVVAQACGRRVALLSLAAYVAMPFAVFWSRAILIDYASVALSLAYLHLALRWSERRSALALAGCLVAGPLAAATKITTLAAILVPVGAVAAAVVVRSVRSSGTLRDGAATAAGMAAVVALPLAAGFAWTRYADVVKAENPYTRFLVSDALRSWTFGSLAQRLKPRCWILLAERIHDAMVPGAFVLLLVAAAAALTLRADARRNAALVAIAGALATIATFFNLFVVHDYYLIAVTPCVAFLIGLGADAIASLELRLRRLSLATAAVLALFTAGTGWKYMERAWRPWKLSNLVELAERIAAATPRDAWVAIEGDDWNPRLLYLAHRRGFMLYPASADFSPVAAHPEVRTLVCSTCSPDLLALWPHRKHVSEGAGFDIYALGSRAERLAGPKGFQ